jgi:hypothetical protein
VVQRLNTCGYYAPYSDWSIGHYPEQGRAATGCVAALLESRGNVLASILQKRLSKLAELVAPIAKLEGTSIIEMQNGDHFSTKLSKVRDLQFEAATKIRKALENLELASQTRPGCNVYRVDEPIPVEREFMELFGG